MTRQYKANVYPNDLSSDVDEIHQESMSNPEILSQASPLQIYQSH
jgi:hypothetical protein